jgi:hypothetical protein
MNKKKYIAPEMTLLIMEQLMVTGASVQGISDPNKTSSLSWSDDNTDAADADDAW